MTPTKRAKAITGGGNDLENLKQECKHKGNNFTDKSAIAHLKHIHIEESRLKHPSLPYHSCPTFTANKTNGLTRCIIHFLRLKNHWCERSGNEGRVIDRRQKVTDILGNLRTIGSIQRVRSSGTPGTSDLKAIVNSRFVAIEVKCSATLDRISPAQIEYRQKIEKAGGLYVVATSFGQFISWFYSNFGGLNNE